MRVSETPGFLKRFRRTPWRFQQTFQTPLNSLPPFVAEIVSALQPIQTATATIARAVFEPRHLAALLAKSKVETAVTPDLSLEAMGESEVTALLTALLSDWTDFAFVPIPKRFAIYADHDEYITFFSVAKSHINRVVHALAEKGFRQVLDYQRHL